MRKLSNSYKVFLNGVQFEPKLKVVKKREKRLSYVERFELAKSLESNNSETDKF